MDTLKALLVTVVGLIPPSAAIRIVLCLVQINTDPEQESLYKRRAMNTFIYAIIAESIFGFLTIVFGYMI